MKVAKGLRSTRRGVVAQYRGARNQKPGGAQPVWGHGPSSSWSHYGRRRSAYTKAKMDIHEDRWPRHLHLVHLVLPTVHLLCRSRSQRRAGAPAPIAAPRWQGGLRRVYQPHLARRKLLSSARVEVPDVLRALLRAHRFLAAEIFRVRSGSGALQPLFAPKSSRRDVRARAEQLSCMLWPAAPAAHVVVELLRW